MALDFPSSPTNGQTFISGTRSWTYNTTTSSWESTTAAAGGGGAASNSFATITAETGTTTANSTTDTLTITGGTDINTSISGDTLTISYTGTGATTLDGLTDVILAANTALQAGDVLSYDGTTWYNDPSVTAALNGFGDALAPLSRQTTTTEIKAISVGTTAPSTPNTGDLWVDTN